MLALVVLCMIPLVTTSLRYLLLWMTRQARGGQAGPGESPRWLKKFNPIITYAALAGAIVAYPLLHGDSPVAYYGAMFPLGPRPLEFVHGFSSSFIYLGLLYVGWLATDNVRFRPRHRLPVILRRLALAPASAVLCAGAEELLFRGMLLAGLMERFSVPVSVAIGVVVFAVAHYLRPVKRYWTFPGHLGLGFVLCMAFVLTESLWLSLGLHAGGILLIMGLRPLIRYNGPSWLVGESIFPYSSVTGIAGLLLLSLNLYMHYGGTP